MAFSKFTGINLLIIFFNKFLDDIACILTKMFPPYEIYSFNALTDY